MGTIQIGFIEFCLRNQEPDSDTGLEKDTEKERQNTFGLPNKSSRGRRLYRKRTCGESEKHIEGKLVAVDAPEQKGAQAT